jgi:methyl-accepting chemotaxis protein
VAEQMETVSDVSEEQSATMEEIASAIKSLAQLAEELEKTVHRFKV